MILRRSLTVLVLALLATGVAAAGSLDDVLSKLYEARGGLDNIESVDSARATGMFEMPGMMEAEITMEWKKPNKLRIEFKSPQGDGVQAYDGNTAWAVMPGAPGPQEMTGDQAASSRRQADFLAGPLVAWKDKGHSVEYVGKEDREGVAVHKLALTFNDGTEMTIFVDAETYLPVHQSGFQKVQGMETDVETYISEYRQVGGLMMAHNIKSELIDVGMTQIVKLENVELNVEIADDRFMMPAVAAEPAAESAGEPEGE
jgi:outer membrane lipoprotein-sorting protein